MRTPSDPPKTEQRGIAEREVLLQNPAFGEKTETNVARVSPSVYRAKFGPWGETTTRMQGTTIVATVIASSRDSKDDST
ncbi:hypothetical protein R1sor_026686 [Riccia sorocarpa]|uniref:Uncharacterized protein n=1 Tax=Riccia sorocarpa TaxID=122646 RepID=A0ABD3GC31_9MARC